MLLFLLAAGCTWIDAADLTERLEKNVGIGTPDDTDLDGDGYLAVGAGGDDCWDDPELTPDGYGALNGLPALTAAEVHPGAEDTTYDGVDADCAGGSDFDQDADGHDTANPLFPRRDGTYGDDCYDAVGDTYPESGAVTEEHAPAAVHPGATDEWYDGTDADCDGADDYDQDGDGFARDVECDDTSAAIFPDPAVPEVWYDDVDDNCDGNRYDKDGDGFESAAHGGDDCWDDDDGVPEGFDALAGHAQPVAADVNPGAEDTWYDGVDGDCAGGDDFDQDGDGDASDEHPDRDGLFGLDCDDTDPTVQPGDADAWYDGVDSDCAGNDDHDADGDGWPLGDDADCDDASATVNPGADERCDALDTDEDCDGLADNDDTSAASADRSTWYPDADRDGFGDLAHAGAAWCDDPTTGGEAWVRDHADCDDTSGSDYPGASETVANGDDEDCDGVDACYTDADGDDYGTTVVIDGSSLDCAGGTGAPVSTDCDDTAPATHAPSAEIVGDGVDQDCDGVDSCYTDADNDNYGTTVVVVGSSLSCATGTGAPVATDCDDASASDYPGATETAANGDDEDCDGVDTCYIDADGDNYGTTGVVDGSSLDCASGTGAPVSTDCDDASSSDYPGATETVANGDDEDCDGVDSCYTDADNDNYGTTVVVDGSSLDCVSGSGAATSIDCDDASNSDYPGATETVANSDDEDCDGVDSCYTDSDNDGYGTTVVVDGSSLNCVSGTGAAVSTDCDDTSATDYPGATETVANSDDEDCDGVDSCYTDTDNDNYGTTAVVDGSSLSCTTGTGAPNDDDCNDGSASVYPAATEACNDIDDDCDSSVDDGLTVYYTDADRDAYGVGTGDCALTSGATNDDDCDDADANVYPAAAELCDGVSNDCATEGAWTEADEDQLVSFVSTSEVWTDVSSSFASTAASSTTASLSSGTYYFCAGTYYTRLVASADTTEIIGVYGADATILENGAATGAVVTVTNGSVLLSGFTVTGGKGASGYGGGIIGNYTGTSPPSAPHLEVEDCVVTGNTAARGGGVASYNNGWVKLVRTTVEGNIATTDGGGIHMNTSADVTLEDSYVQDNTATGDGGGIFVDDGTLVMTRSAVANNYSGDDGGGLFIDTGTATCTSGGINSNDATDYGGGVYMSNATSTTASFTATSCDFGTGGTDNTLYDVTLKTGGYQNYTSYGATATFVCTNASGVCTP